MTLLQLRYFRRLAYTLHYTHAAEELHVAQSSLSYSIGQLEKELGVKLFRKKNHKIELTIQGRQFLACVEGALAFLDQGIAELEQTKGTSSQIVNLGYVRSASDVLVSALVEQFYQDEKNKNIQFQFEEGSSFYILNQIKTGALDIAIGVQREDEVESVAIMRQPLYLAVSNDHPLACRDYVEFDDFAQEYQIMIEKPSGLNEQINQVFTRYGIKPKMVFQVRECDTALQYVALKLGVAVLPFASVAREKNISMIPIFDSDQEFVRTIYLLWSRVHTLSWAATKVRDFIIDQASLKGSIIQD